MERDDAWESQAWDAALAAPAGARVEVWAVLPDGGLRLVRTEELRGEPPTPEQMQVALSGARAWPPRVAHLRAIVNGGARGCVIGGVRHSVIGCPLSRESGQK